MGALIWMIVIGVLAYRAVKKNLGPEEKRQTVKKAASGTKPERKQAVKPSGQQVPDIVSRARANSARYALQDETLQELEREHRHSEHVPPVGAKHANMEETKHAHASADEFIHPLEDEPLLGSIEDLMVKGYDGNLSFERDFLAEAMDMINSFTL